MNRSIICGLFTLAFGFAASACSSTPDVTTPTPTPPTIIAEPDWTGTLTLNGSQTLPFITTAAGQVSVTIFSLEPNPDLTVRVGLQVGRWNGQACELVIANDNAGLGTVIYGGATTSGPLCARISDAGKGGMTEPVDFLVRITHP
jgi:hypothetical protein